MAVTGNVGMYFLRDLSNPESKNMADTGKVVKISIPILQNKRAYRSLPAKACSDDTSKINYLNVGVINGKRINGINMGEPPYVGKRSAEFVKELDQDIPAHAFQLGRFVDDRFVYRQTFVIRSYEIGPDKTATMETLMNLLQETALNHVMSSGLAGDGFGATLEMSRRKLIWVVTRIHIQVEKYSSWGDVVEIDTWVDAAGKNGMRRDWIIREYNTQDVITRATRYRFFKFKVREEVKPFYLYKTAMTETGISKNIDKLNDESAENIRSGLAPRWSDMDANQHVNNVKYIGWILESVPVNVLEDYTLRSMTLEYRRECRQSELLESLTSMRANVAEDPDAPNTISCRKEIRSTHLIRMQEDKVEIVRARSEWQLKQK